MTLSGARNVLETIDLALNKLYRLCGAIAAVAIALIALLVAASIIFRLAGIYVGGLTEGAGYAMAAAGTFGLAWTFGTGGHIRVDLVINKLSTTARPRFEFAALLITTTAITFLAWYFVRMVLISWSYGDLSGGSDSLPLWLPQLPAAIGFCVFAVSLIHSLIRYHFTRQITWHCADPGLLDDSKGAIDGS